MPHHPHPVFGEGVVVSCSSEYILLIFFCKPKTQQCTLNNCLVIPDLYGCSYLINPSPSVGTSEKLSCLIAGDNLTPVRSMSQAITVSWSRVDATYSEASVQVDKLSNHNLILRCQAGQRPDKAAFAELLRRYQTQVDRVLYHLAPDWSDRADLAQEVWIRVYRNINRLQEPAKFRGWLSRITTNLFYDELRKRKRVVSPLSLDAPRSLEDGEMDWQIAGDTPGPEEELTTREFYEQLRDAIADLPEVFRTTIVLREIEGMAYEEIAEITGVSLGTVKSRIARARSRLQAQLQTYLDT
jgi:RNA polymerase sigma-70 factor (ECF subfamily)